MPGSGQRLATALRPAIGRRDKRNARSNRRSLVVPTNVNTGQITRCSRPLRASPMLPPPTPVRSPILQAGVSASLHAGPGVRLRWMLGGRLQQLLLAPFHLLFGRLLRGDELVTRGRERPDDLVELDVNGP